MKTRIFISGPISMGDLTHNLEQAFDATRSLLRQGYAVYTPHCYCNLDGKPASCSAGLCYEDWMSQDASFLSVCDGLLRLPGVSLGAERLVSTARKLDIPVFYSEYALTNYFAHPSRLGLRAPQEEWSL